MTIITAIISALAGAVLALVGVLAWTRHARDDERAPEPGALPPRTLPPLELPDNDHLGEHADETPPPVDMDPAARRRRRRRRRAVSAIDDV